jgi:hypothetical protein
LSNNYLKAGPSYSRGASTAEFIIVVPLFILMVFLILEMGLMYRAKFTLNHAAQQIARAGSLNNGCMAAMDDQAVRSLATLYLRSEPSLLHFYRLKTLKSEAIKLYSDIDIVMPNDATFGRHKMLGRLSPSQLSDCARQKYRLNPYQKVFFIPLSAPVAKAKNAEPEAPRLLKIQVRYCYRLIFPIIRWVIDSLQSAKPIGITTKTFTRQCINGAKNDLFGAPTQQFVVLTAHASAWMQTPFLQHALQEQ